MLAAKAWYFIYFGSGAFAYPFLNVWYRRRGFTEQQIGLLSALRPWVSAIVGGGCTAFADRIRAHRPIMFIAYALSTAAKFSISQAKTYPQMLLLIVTAEGLTAPVMILADSSVMAACPEEGDYGRQRVWGAVGWGIFCAVGGAFVQRYGIHAGFWMMLAWLVIAFIPTSLLPLHALHYKASPTPAQSIEPPPDPHTPQPPTPAAVTHLEDHPHQQSAADGEIAVPDPITPGQWVASHALPSSPAQRALSGHSIDHPSNVGSHHADEGSHRADGSPHPHQHEASLKVHWQGDASGDSQGDTAHKDGAIPLDSHYVDSDSETSPVPVSRWLAMRTQHADHQDYTPSDIQIRIQQQQQSQWHQRHSRSPQSSHAQAPSHAAAADSDGIGNKHTRPQVGRAASAEQNAPEQMGAAALQNGHLPEPPQEPGAGTAGAGLASYPVSSAASAAGSDEEESSMSLWALEGSAPLPMAPDLQGCVRAPELLPGVSPTALNLG
ncbi:hypothetical protein WJX74_008676 [Apatococcus lobatus]|uniref:Major facilitator superfamily associated domain-containing protein n=1 Tax=Apatococcus lobatus TaxID=904363 RepID=A0AAW1Q5V4_9CHLO